MTLDESYCGHGNTEEDCDEVCNGCGHTCLEHHEGECSGAINGYSGGGHHVDAECDCSGFGG